MEYGNPKPYAYTYLAALQAIKRPGSTYITSHNGAGAGVFLNGVMIIVIGYIGVVVGGAVGVLIVLTAMWRRRPGPVCFEDRQTCLALRAVPGVGFRAPGVAPPGVGF
jgi:O-antigen/teichoic acid export membrane protein